MLQLRNKSASKGPLWLVEEKYTLGSDSACDVKVLSPGVQSQHAELRINGDQVHIVNLVDGDALTVNGKPVTGPTPLKVGDVLKLGKEAFDLVDPKSVSRPKPAAAPTTQGWAFKALNTALAEKQFPLAGQQSIGRSQDCDISLGVVHLSRKHAQVTVTDNGLKIEDLNSSNGTYLNGKKVSQAIAIAGDEVSFDTLRFRVIGPIIDEDKTTMRPSSDGELTTIRPALNIPGAPKPAAARPQASAKPRPKTAARPNRAVTKPQPQVQVNASQESSEGGKSMGMILAGLAVVVGAAVAWFLLK